MSSTSRAARRLAARLSEEDAAEARGLDPFERVTCGIHRRWLHQCISSPLHVVAVTGYRWCRDCECPVDVAVDELTRTVRLRCPGCGRAPDSPAARQILRTCRAGLAASRGQRERTTSTGQDEWCSSA